MTNCSSAISYIVTNYASVAAGDSAIASVVNALSAILQKGTSLPSQLRANVTNAISLLNAARHSVMSVGENPLELVSNTLGIKVAVKYSVDLQTGLAPALSSALKALGSVSTFLAMNTSSFSHDLIGISLTSYSTNPHVILANKTTPNSVSLKVDVDYLDSASSSVFTVVMQNLASVDYTYYPAKNKTYYCDFKSSAFYVRANCTGPSSFSIFCPGTTRRTVKYTCPSYQNQPSCNLWDGTQYTKPSICKVSSYTSLTTTCTCRPIPSGRRSLATSSSKQSMEFASSASLVETNFVNTWKSAGNLNAKTVASNWVRIILCTFHYFF